MEVRIQRGRVCDNKVLLLLLKPSIPLHERPFLD